MNWVEVIAGGICLSVAGFVLGSNAHQKEVRRNVKTIVPLLTESMLRAVDNAFDSGKTKTEVLEELKQDLKFIEQVV